MIIRLATPDQLDALLDMREEAARWLATRGTDQWSAPWPDRERMRQMVHRSIGAGKVWAAYDGEALVATLTLDEWANPDLWTPQEAAEPARYLHRLIVRRSHRGMNLGAKLIDWCGTKAANDGARWLRLDAWTTNQPLHEYYRRLGFQHVRTLTLAHNPSGALFQRPTRSLSNTWNPRLPLLRTE